MLPAQPNRSLIDGLTCLQALAGHRSPVGSRALARESGLEPTRVNRLLKTLAHLGMAQQIEDRRYISGPGMHVLAAMSLFGSGLVRQALGPLEALHRFGLTVALGVLWRDQVSYLYHGEPGMTAAMALGRVGLFPATRSSIGLVLLCRETDEQVRSLFDGREIAGFPGGVNALLATLGEVRLRGYARVDGEAEPGHVSLAVPVGEDPYAAIAIAGRMSNEMIVDLVGALRVAAMAIARPEAQG